MTLCDIHLIMDKPARRSHYFFQISLHIAFKSFYSVSRRRQKNHLRKLRSASDGDHLMTLHRDPWRPTLINISSFRWRPSCHMTTRAYVDQFWNITPQCVKFLVVLVPLYLLSHKYLYYMLGSCLYTICKHKQIMMPECWCVFKIIFPVSIHISL